MPQTPAPVETATCWNDKLPDRTRNLLDDPRRELPCIPDYRQPEQGAGPLLRLMQNSPL